MSCESHAIFCLSQVKGIGYATLEKLRATYPSYSAILEHFSDWSKNLRYPVPPQDLQLKIKSLQQQLTNLGHKYLTLADPQYPLLLKQIADPPLVLYYLGDLASLSRDSLAVVGTRKPTPYATQVIHRLLPALCQSQIVIVSGFQRGIDQKAHQLAVDNACPTIAVLGTGLDVEYPYGSRKLFHQILNGSGLILSEYLPGTPAHAYNFPYRNRIVSGLSKGVLVIEAALQSGSLNTVTHALDQGREVWSVPGPITSDVSSGTNYIIQQGARLVAQSSDLLEFFGRQAQSSLAPDCPEHLLPLYQLLRKKPLAVDELLSTLTIDYSRLMEQLSELEILGRISVSGSGEYYPI